MYFCSGKPMYFCSGVDSDLLAPAYNWFTEGLETPVLQEAKALLAELAS